MTDRGKVITHFRDAIEASGDGNKWRFVRVDILEEAIELLKEQEPVKPVEKRDHGFYYACGSCWEMLGIVREYPSYCPCCGKKVKWDG